jgi:hypothetical protein
MRRLSKRGNILTENVMFIILNLMFITILMLFLFSKMGSAAILEENYAKQIAMVLDSVRPGMTIHLDMGDAVKKAEKELGTDKIGNLVSINENIVTVRLQEGTGYSYSFFNDVEVTAYLDKVNEEEYVFIINSK